jgi:membrane protein DedA with SNARE-associated domain
MNALGAVCWASVVGGGAFMLGDRIRSLLGPIGMILLASAFVPVVAGALFVRRHEAVLEKRARAVLGVPAAGSVDVGDQDDRNG